MCCNIGDLHMLIDSGDFANDSALSDRIDQMDVKFIEMKRIKQRAVLSMVWKADNRNPALKNCMDLLLKL